MDIIRTAQQFFEWGKLFLAPLFLLNYFLSNLFLFLQESGREGSKPFQPSLGVVLVL